MDPHPQPLTTIGDLFDELLIEIFTRLDSYETVVTSRFVSKRWSSLLSNPKFVVKFVSHKKKLQKQHQQQLLPWTFISTMQLNNPGYGYSISKQHHHDHRANNIIPSHKVFFSPKFTLNFLPCQSINIAATFKDLVLCIGKESRKYYICNPMTKQWTSLPCCGPSPNDSDHDNDSDNDNDLSSPSSTWACLLCEDPYYNDNKECIDYRFRVVVVNPIPKRRHYLFGGQRHPFKIFKLMVFCSEGWEWRNIDFKVPAPPKSMQTDWGDSSNVIFNGVVCKGMVCLRYREYFGMLNPFDITLNSSSTTVESRNLRLTSRGRVFECGDELILLYINETFHWIFPFYWNREEMRVLYMINKGLDLNQVDTNINDESRIPWKVKFRRNLYDKSRSISESNTSISTTSCGYVMGMHPTDNQFLYVLKDKNQVVLCDMRTFTLKSLGTLFIPYQISTTFYKLQLQYWPTPVPVPQHH